VRLARGQSVDNSAYEKPEVFASYQFIWNMRAMKKRKGKATHLT
jgi:hypothetical protein